MADTAHFKYLAPLLCLLSASAAAEEVTTTSLETGIPVTGELLSYDDEFLVMDTAFGPLKLLRASVRCDGALCPPAPQDARVTTKVSAKIPTAGAILAVDGPTINLKVAIAPDHAEQC